MEVAHQGRVFTSRTMERGSIDEQALQLMNRQVLTSLGLVQGISHTEFIKGKEHGRFFFLETSARVGGAHIAEMIDAASGLNYWREWAKIEILRGNEPYKLPEYKNDYSGILLSLAKQEWPDLAEYNEPEVAWKLKKKYHAGLIVSSPNRDRVSGLLTSYTKRFYDDFFTWQPIKDKPSS